MLRRIMFNMAALAKYRERPLWHKWDMHAVPQASQPRTRWRHAYHSRFICQSSAAQASPLFEDITSLQNTLVKHCVKVRQKKGYREEEGTVILSGSDLVEEVAEHGASIKVLFVTQGADIPGIPAKRMVRVTPAVMQKITGLESVSLSTLAAEVSIPQPADFVVGWRRGQLRRLLVLERLQDPGNLGTLLRTALAIGWDGVLLLPGCCDPFNDKALRAGRGAAFKLPLAWGTLEDLQEAAAAHQLLCLAAEPHATSAQVPRQQVSASARNGTGTSNGNGTTTSSAENQGGSDAGWDEWLQGGDAAGPAEDRQGQYVGQGVCLVLGSEGQGLSDEVLGMSTPINVPMVGPMESLNVGAAGAILMFALSSGAPQLSATLDGLTVPRQKVPDRQRVQQQGREKQQGRQHDSRRQTAE